MTQAEFIQVVESTLGDRVNRDRLLITEDEALAQLLLEIWSDARKSSFYGGVVFYNALQAVCNGNYKVEWCRAKGFFRSACKSVTDREPEFVTTLAWFLVQFYFPE